MLGLPGIRGRAIYSIELHAVEAQLGLLFAMPTRCHVFFPFSCRAFPSLFSFPPFAFLFLLATSRNRYSRHTVPQDRQSLQPVRVLKAYKVTNVGPQLAQQATHSCCVLTTDGVNNWETPASPPPPPKLPPQDLQCGAGSRQSPAAALGQLED